MRLKLFICLCALLITVLSTNLFAQGKRHREYSGFFDSYYYRGPITYTVGFNAALPRTDVSGKLGYGMSIGANYKVWPMVVLGAELSYFMMSGNGSPDTSYTATFTSSNIELVAYGRLYFLDEAIRISPDRKKEREIEFFRPYLMGGVGGLISTYTVSKTALTTSFLATGSAGNTIAPVFPVGLGVSLHPSQRLSFAIEASYRFTFSDKLDGVSKGGNDAYAFVGFKVQYSPSSPKKKQKMSLPPPAKYDGPKGTKTWKNTPREEPKPKNNYEEPIQEEGTQEEGTQEEGTQEEGVQEEQPQEESQESPDKVQEENSGW